MDRAKPIRDKLPPCFYCNQPIAYYATRDWAIKCHRCGGVTGSSGPMRPPAEHRLKHWFRTT